MTYRIDMTVMKMVWLNMLGMDEDSAIKYLSHTAFFVENGDIDTMSDKLMQLSYFIASCHPICSATACAFSLLFARRPVDIPPDIRLH